MTEDKLTHLSKAIESKGKISKRDFLKLAGLGLGSLFVGGELISLSGCAPGANAPAGVFATLTPEPDGLNPVTLIFAIVSPENHGTLPTEVPYPTTTEGFAYGIGGNETDFIEQINLESLGDSARVEYVVKWAIYRSDHNGLFYSENKVNGENVLVQEKEVLDYYDKNYKTQYSVVPGKSWSLAAQNKDTNEFFVAVNKDNEAPYLNLIPSDTDGDGFFTVDEFTLSKIAMPQWADGQALIPVTDGTSKGYNVIVFTSNEKVVGWYDAANNQQIKAELAEIVPQNIEQIITDKKFELKNGKIYNGEQELGNLVIKDEAGFLQLKVEGKDYEINLEKLVHTLPKEGETHLWFNEDVKDAVWGADEDQGLMFQVREGKWETNSLEVEWPDSPEQAIKIVDPEQIDTYMEANYDRWMEIYISGARKSLGMAYRRPDDAYRRIDLLHYGEEFNRDRRTDVFSLEVKFTDPNGVVWTDSQFSIFPNRIFYTANDNQDYIMTLKVSAFSKNLMRSDGGSVEPIMTRSRHYASEVWERMTAVAIDSNEPALTVGAIARISDTSPDFDQMMDYNLWPEYFVSTIPKFNLMDQMSEYQSAKRPPTEADIKLYKNLLPVTVLV